MIMIILCLQPPHTQRLIIDFLGNEKDVEPEYILLNLKLSDKILMKQMQISANK